MDNFFSLMQRLGRTFMLPIALLPVAGLFLGIGATITGDAFVAQYGLESILGDGTFLNGVLSILTDVGDIIFGNLSLLFAISVATGFAKERKEVAGLSAVVGFLVMYRSLTSSIAHFGNIEELRGVNGLVGSVLGMDDTLNMGVFGGIIIGLTVAYLHNKYYDVRFTDALSFFAGTHFVPIISSVAGLVLGFILAFVWPYVGMGIAWLGETIAGSGAIGSFFYGYVYRALIPFGLHHVFYLPFWQTAMGGSMEVAGQVVNGAQNIVFAQLQAGDAIAPAAAKYFSFAFPMMLFGFPAAALAMYHTAREDRKDDVKGLLLSSSLTSFITGITEPIEFSILFASPFLYYGVNAVLAGLSVIIVQLLKIGVGFTFSAGFLDFFLYGMLPGNARTNWIILLVYSIIWGALYYVIFRWAIVKWDLKTPGREADDEATRLRTKDEYREAHGIGEDAKTGANLSPEEQRSAQILEGLGGYNNLEEFSNCATRLRVTVKEADKVDQAVLRRTGAAGVTQSGKSVQVIYGTQVGGIATDLDHYIKRHRDQLTQSVNSESTPVATAATVTEVEAPAPTSTTEEITSTTEHTAQDIFSPLTGELMNLADTPDPAFASGALGQGVAINPSSEEVVAPFDGEVVMIFGTKHAIGLKSDAGVEVLIHIGLDTVNLAGEGFETFVEQGARVTKGQKLITFDAQKIKDAGYSTVTPVVITNANEFSEVTPVPAQSIATEDLIITVK